MSQEEFNFDGNDGVKLYAKKDLVDKAKAVIVIVHGIFEHCDRYNYLVSKLNEASYNVYRYDARGHGRSEGNRGDVNNFEDFINDLNNYIDLIKKENPTLKLVLLGHSMGGLVATYYGAKFSDKIDFLVLSGACNQTPKQAKPLKFIPTFVTKLFKYKNNLGDGVCSDKEVIEAYNSDPLVLKEGRLRLMKNAFIKGCEYVNNNIEKIQVPTLVMQGEKDGIVVCSTSEWTYNHLLIEDKTLKIYKGLYHEIFNEIKKDVVIGDLLEWLNKEIGG